MPISRPMPGRSRDERRYGKLIRLQRRDALRTLNAADRHAFRPHLPRRSAGGDGLQHRPAGARTRPPEPTGRHDRAARAHARRGFAGGRQAGRDGQEAGRRPHLARSACRTRRRAEEAGPAAADHPTDLDAQLAKLGSLEDALRSRVDPQTEQRAAAIYLSVALAEPGRDRQRQQPERRSAEDQQRPEGTQEQAARR